MEIILFFIGVVITLVICFTIYFISLRPRLQQQREKDQLLIVEEQKLKTNIAALQKEQYNLQQNIDSQQTTSKNLQEDIIKKQAQKEALINGLEDLKVQSQAAADAIYEKNYSLMATTFEHSAELLGEQYRQESANYQQEYLTMLQDLTLSFTNEVAEKKVEIANAEALLAELKAKVWAAVMADKRALEIQEQANYYKLNLSKSDIEEIEKLRSVIPYLKDQEPLNKVIWKVYYEKPYTDLVGRVVGADVRTGIYKITNLTNQMCYVGQAVDIAARWKQHIKRGLGADTPTRNKLYPAMIEFGVENFSFEVVEECDRSLLDEREGYWQEYFKAKEFGYSIK